MRLTWLLVTTLALHLPVDAAWAQTRGSPPTFESVYGAAARAGLEFRHGGELEGNSLTMIASKSFGFGVKRRLTLSGAAGVWDAPRGDTRLTGALGAQYRLWGRSIQGEVGDLTLRAMAGIGAVSDAGRARWSVPIGIGMAYQFPYPAIQIEPWIMPHLVWRERSPRSDARAALPTGDNTLKPGISAGIITGIGKLAGLRIAAACCVGGVAASYSLSVWY